MKLKNHHIQSHDSQNQIEIGEIVVIHGDWVKLLKLLPGTDCNVRSVTLNIYN